MIHFCLFEEANPTASIVPPVPLSDVDAAEADERARGWRAGESTSLSPVGPRRLPRAFPSRRARSLHSTGDPRLSASGSSGKDYLDITQFLTHYFLFFSLSFLLQYSTSRLYPLIAFFLPGKFVFFCSLTVTPRDGGCMYIDH